jgi:hypothetical protein
LRERGDLATFGVCPNIGDFGAATKMTLFDGDKKVTTTNNRLILKKTTAIRLYSNTLYLGSFNRQEATVAAGAVHWYHEDSLVVPSAVIVPDNRP